MTMEYSQFLAHYGVKGQKWGVRQWQNEDGTYTDAGKHHYGWGNGRSVVGEHGESAQPRRQVNRRQQYTRTEDRKTDSEKRHEAEARKATALKIMAAASGVTLAALAVYGLHRRRKAMNNLIKVARRNVDLRYRSHPNLQSVPRNEAELRSAQQASSWWLRDRSSINSVRAAKKELHLRGRRETRRFIRENRLWRG